MQEGTGHPDDSANLPRIVPERFLGSSGPIDESVAARDEFDLVDEGLSSGENLEVVFPNLFPDVFWDVVVISFTQNLIVLLGIEDLAKPLVIGHVATVSIFDEEDEAGDLVKDRREVAPHPMLLKEAVILHEFSGAKK